MDLSHIPETLETSRLTIRRIQPAFAFRIFSRIDSDRARLRRHLFWVDHTKTEADTLEFVQYSIQAWRNLTEFNYSIFIKDADELIGGFGVIVTKQERAEFGYWISSAFESRGLISEAVEGMTQMFFKLGFPRLEIRCGMNNEKSEKVAIRAGFKFDKIIPNLQMGPGIFRDSKVFYRLSPIAGRPWSPPFRVV